MEAGSWLNLFWELEPTGFDSVGSRSVTGLSFACFALCSRFGCVTRYSVEECSVVFVFVNVSIVLSTRVASRSLPPVAWFPVEGIQDSSSV